MREISLTRGAVALVDDEDFEWLSQWSWFVNVGYAQRTARRTEPLQRRKSIYMHRVILDAPDDLEVDHRNGIRSDNRRSNLRLCTINQNRQNSAPRYGKRFKGVHANGFGNYVAQIRDLRVPRKVKHLGTFRTEEEAARAYDIAARRQYGEFARLNFPDLAEVV